MLKVTFKRLGLSNTIIEGFYSARFGFIAVDAAIVNGKKLIDTPYSERFKIMNRIVSQVNSRLFKVGDLKTSSRTDLGCSAYSVVHSSVLFLKKENSVPLSLMNDVDTLIIDDLMPERASLHLDGEFIECLNVTYVKGLVCFTVGLITIFLSMLVLCAFGLRIIKGNL